MPQIIVEPFSTERTHLREKALHSTGCLGIAKFLASNGWIEEAQYVYRTI
jgi:hypothetical protein